MGPFRIALLLSILPSLAGADTLSNTDRHREGEYGGVTPGVVFPYEDLPKHRILWKNNQKNSLYWIGFQPRPNQSARVFLQLSEIPDFKISARKNKVVVFLPQMRPRRGNWWRPIYTTHFGTHLKVISVKRVRKNRKTGQEAGLEVIMDFGDKAPPAPQTSTAKLKDGFHYLMLSFEG